MRRGYRFSGRLGLGADALGVWLSIYLATAASDVHVGLLSAVSKRNRVW